MLTYVSQGGWIEGDVGGDGMEGGPAMGTDFDVRFKGLYMDCVNQKSL